MSLKVAVLSSSSGSTFQGLLDRRAVQKLPNIEFGCFITNKPEALSLEKAKQEGISHIHVLTKKPGETREEYDQQLIHLLANYQPDLILCLGWLRILSPVFCSKYEPITLNVHPSLLPKYPRMMGDAIHEAVLKNGDSSTGCTIHQVSSEVDGGKIIQQNRVFVTPGETIESLRKKVQQQEVEAFTTVLQNLDKYQLKNNSHTL